jgi:hypothetical protein
LFQRESEKEEGGENAEVKFNDDSARVLNSFSTTLLIDFLMSLQLFIKL